MSINSDDTALQKDAPIKATLTVKFRLADHSQETNFFGEVPATIFDFDLVKGSAEQEVWRDTRCHHQRGGFPKMTVIAVDGEVSRTSDKKVIEAKYRQRGLPMPHDEVMMAHGLRFGADEHGSFVATQTETKQSRISIYLKLYILPCDL